METEYIPCNDLTYFEMSSALRWAMYTMNSFSDVKLVLDVTSVDKTSRWFLENNIPQAYANTKLVKWFGIQKENSIEYTNGKGINTIIVIHAFTYSRFPFEMYVSLYDMSTSTRFAPMCLIVWDRKHPEVTNQGYAEGRCPHILQTSVT